MSETPLFAFVQLEFGFLLGPPDGRFVVREAAGDDPDAVLVLATLGAIERRRLRPRRREPAEASPEPVPTTRVTVVRAEPFDSRSSAGAWLSGVRKDEEAAGAELAKATRHANRAIQAYRTAHANPRARDVAPDAALVVRLGFGSGEEVASGRYSEAWRMPIDKAPRRRSMDTPDDRFAALLGATDDSLTCEELVMRARLDVDAGRAREAALQARVALEALLADLEATLAPARRSTLEEDRALVGTAANAALSGPLTDDLDAGVSACVEHMEDALRAHSLAKRDRR